MVRSLGNTDWSRIASLIAIDIKSVECQMLDRSDIERDNRSLPTTTSALPAQLSPVQLSPAQLVDCSVYRLNINAINMQL
jgi:hypothetical protein